MRRLFLVFSLSGLMYVAGTLVIGLMLLVLAVAGASRLADPFLSVSLSLLIVLAPMVAARIVPGGFVKTWPATSTSCPCCGALVVAAKPQPDPSWTL